MKSELYAKTQAASLAAGEIKDCCVKLVALALDIEYADAHKACREYGRRDRKGMHWKSCKNLLLDSGLELEVVDPRKLIDQYPGVHKNLMNITTHHPIRFNKVWNDGNKYILLTRDHVAYVADGILHDWTEGLSLRVMTLYRIK